MKIDITIVCGRRPELLSKTLASFNDKVFENFEVGTVFANIDPFCGVPEDGDLCEKLLRDQFDDLEISRPKHASFGGAVKRLWAKPKSEFLLHLEDDWQVLHPISPADIETRLRDQIVQVQLSALDKPYLPHKYSYKVTWRKILGLKLLKKTHFERPLFSTSPSFYKSDFVRQCADLMVPEKDPEKQLYEDGTALGDFTKTYLNWPLNAPDRSPLVVDLGRPWLSEKGMRKKIVNGVSIWERE